MTAKRYGPHDPDTAPTTVEVPIARGSRATHRVPLDERVMVQRAQVNAIAAGLPVPRMPRPMPSDFRRRSRQ